MTIFLNHMIVTCRRKALCNYTFQDGSKVAKDDWVCIPQLAMMHDQRRYSNPHEFHGSRFAEANVSLKAGQATIEVPDKVPTSFTTVNIDWPIWGLGNTAWYANCSFYLNHSRQQKHAVKTLVFSY